LGFQLLKNWSDSLNSTKRILESPFIIQRLESDQAIIPVKILRGLTNIELIQKRLPGLYEIGENEVQGYRVESGVHIDPDNAYKDRYILL